MAVTVTLPPALVRLFPGADRRLEVPATTVAEAVDALEARLPGMRDRLCDPTPRLRRQINVFVGGRKATLATPLADGAEVVILLALVGG
ncbi:MAG: MoaD/ThiS family protein [Geminicoccaceae bacterium]